MALDVLLVLMVILYSVIGTGLIEDRQAVRARAAKYKEVNITLIPEEDE